MRNIKYHISNFKGWGWVAIACVVVATIALLAARRPPDKAWNQVRQSGVVRFGMDPNYWPFDGLTVSGEFAGLDVDLAREIAGRLGLRAEFVIIGSDGLYDALTTGRCDAVISALTPDAKRRWDTVYTTPYFDAGLVFVLPAASASRFGGDLTGRTIAVEFGSDGDARARWLVRRTVGLRVLTRDTLDEAMQAVESGLADAALTDTTTARQYIAGHPALGIGSRQTSDPYVIAVRMAAPELFRALDRALAQIKADGTLERIIEQWLDH